MKFIEIPIQTVTIGKENQDIIPKEDLNISYCSVDIDEIAVFYDNGENTTILLKTGDSFLCDYDYRVFKDVINNCIKIS